MKQRHALLSLAIAASVLVLSSCTKGPTPGAEGTAGTQAPPKDETADQFVARVSDEYRDIYTELSRAQWIASTYINDDSEAISAATNERFLTRLNSSAGSSLPGRMNVLVIRGIGACA